MEDWSNILILILSVVAMIGGRLLKLTNKKKVADQSLPEVDDIEHDSDNAPLPPFRRLYSDDPYDFGMDKELLPEKGSELKKERIPEVVGQYELLEVENPYMALKQPKPKQLISSISSKIDRISKTSSESFDGNEITAIDDDRKVVIGSKSDAFDARKAVIYSEILKTKF